MFPGIKEIELESGRLRSGKIFWMGKRRRTATMRGSCSMTRGYDYNLMLHSNEGSFNEEEGYQLISKRE